LGNLILIEKLDPLGYFFITFQSETVPKIHIVILSEAKNLLFFFSSQKSKEEILRTYVLRMTDKGKLVKILEHSPFQS
jgi:hypothetical protein